MNTNIAADVKFLRKVLFGLIIATLISAGFVGVTTVQAMQAAEELPKSQNYN